MGCHSHSCGLGMVKSVPQPQEGSLLGGQQVPTRATEAQQGQQQGRETIRKESCAHVTLMREGDVHGIPRCP